MLCCRPGPVDAPAATGSLPSQYCMRYPKGQEHLWTVDVYRGPETAERPAARR